MIGGGSSRAGWRPAVGPVRRGLAGFLRVPFTLRTWREFAYLLACVPVGVAGLAYLVVGFGVAAVLAVTFLGVPVLAVAVVGARGWGTVYRWLSAVMLRAPVPAPAPFRARSSATGWLRAALSDRTGWRTCGFLGLKLPLTFLGAYGAVLLWVESWFLVISPLLWWLTGATNVDAHGVRHHALFQIGPYWIDTWPRSLLVAAAGAVTVFLTAWPIRWFAQLDRWLIATLLGLPRQDRRVRHLERSRAVAVEDSAATLRRVERDLHDGTQARLVTVAMNLSRARTRLAHNDPDGVDELLDAAHSTATEALAELRDIIRGIHPPALDMGLDAALETLAARAGLPVRVATRLPARPVERAHPAVETIAYFCVAELLTNVTRHSGARSARIDAVQEGDRLTLRVWDDGHGGARIGAGSGLRGLRERVGVVDGTLSVSSPPGGPTEVAVVLPVTGPDVSARTPRTGAEP